MSDRVYVPSSPETSSRRYELAPGADARFHEFSRAVFADGALPAKTKQLIAVAVAHVTQCPYCIRGHTRATLRAGTRSRRSWRRSGWPRRCAPAAHSRTPPLALDEMAEAEKR